MAQGHNSNFLTIPSQEGIFKTVRVERSDENSNDEDEEETEEDVRLIPRSSPVPRKRGSSIADETAEYMRISLVLTNRSVSFADSTGAELVDVRMFVPFDSDEEDDSRWEEEQARYRKAYREPTYRVWPEIQPLTGVELVLAVHSNKLEVESVTSVPDEPLSFEVLIRVLNISFHKSVYVRSTMDGWINHFDYPAEYVQGSNDGETDKFSVKLSFASPYLFNGARIDFVVRYETPDGEFWANNSGRNYSVTLLQWYEEDTVQATSADTTELRGILKPPRADIHYDDSNDGEDDLSNTKCEEVENPASFAQPVPVQPEIDIDIETAKNLSSSPESTRISSTAGCPQSTSDTPLGEPLALESMSSNNLPQTEESGLQQLTLSIPQSRSTPQFSEPQDQVYNVGPSLTLPLPAVIIHYCDLSETTKDEFEDSSKPEQALLSQKDDFHTEMLAQVPFELSQPSLAGFPDMPQILEEGMNNINVFEDVGEKDATLADMLEELSRNVENKTGTCFHMLEEAKQLHPSKEVNDATKEAKKPDLSEALQHPLEEGIQEQKVELVSSVRVDTIAAIEVESTKMDVLEASCLFPSYLGPTRPDKESQSLLVHPDSDKPVNIKHLQEEELVLDPSMLTSVHPKDPKLDHHQTITTCIPAHPTSKPEKPELTSISEASPKPASTVNTSAEDDLSFKGDEMSTAPYQMCKDPETQHTLPRPGTEPSPISKDQNEVSLDTCLMVSATFLSAVICLAVGIQEPSVFLCVGLFLLSLWF
ncbi:protein phosphatase 1 regulatory subunit 3A isoform X2 [Carassius gibelio]|uniref:protein phosphatase 1 regulatory subunit 3A isoform X2 n=1 Tax=Carassius gibelio TaxID=101364 RepID=UPI002278D591|nr:protein phosphatase 1 regulatory subunit 3A isoform X2 [Carassius gibelio]